MMPLRCYLEARRYIKTEGGWEPNMLKGCGSSLSEATYDIAIYDGEWEQVFEGMTMDGFDITYSYDDDSDVDVTMVLDRGSAKLTIELTRAFEYDENGVFDTLIISTVKFEVWNNDGTAFLQIDTDIDNGLAISDNIACWDDIVPMCRGEFVLEGLKVLGDMVENELMENIEA
jgi:hypothetical protein